MSTECTPITTLPHTTRLFREYLAMGESAPALSDGTALSNETAARNGAAASVRDTVSPVRAWYGAEPLGGAWMQPPAAGLSQAHTAALADALQRQSISFGAGAATLANIARLRGGARAVVTGQQVGLFGGPLLTLLKAASAVARAKQATTKTGIEHVPIFWLATEDHDLAEIDQVALLSKNAVETLRLNARSHSAPVGDIPLGPGIDALLDQASELLHDSPISEVLRECYATHDGITPTFGGAFARLMTRLFSEHGLIVMDASGREFHSLGTPTLRYAIEHAEELETALLARTTELETAGYHAQVMVKSGTSLLFLVSEIDGAQNRQALRRTPEAIWKISAGASAKSFSTAELLSILDATPERLSPNALLRPVFQDTILPTTAYIGGPAEVAYFAQSAVLYQRILGRITPILPRLTATLVEPAIGALMDRHEVALTDAMHSTDELAQRLGARAMPVEAKRRLADAGNALDEALSAAQDYLGGLDESLGRSAEVSASKMRYQMNRLRRLAATFELQKEACLRKHAEAITLHLFPNAHPQERLLAGVWFVAAWETAHGDASGFIERLVEEAAGQDFGHLVIRL